MQHDLKPFGTARRFGKCGFLSMAYDFIKPRICVSRPGFIWFGGLFGSVGIPDLRSLATL